MRILQILPEMNVGGVETGTVDLVKYLIRHGHEAVVISNGGVLIEKLKTLGAKHYSLPVHKKSLWTVLRMIKEVRKIIQEEKVDIVHARSRVPAWIAYFACQRTSASFITTCHGYYSQSFLSRVMGWGKLVIVPSQVIGRHMIHDFKVPPENIRYIPRSVDLEKFNVPREDKKGQSSFIVTMVGRITPLKGHIYFIKAMAKLIRAMPYVRVWLIGDAPQDKDSYKRELEQLVERHGLKEHVTFLGNRQDIPELLSKVDVLVLATVTQEAFGRVILEAQASGVPVVATKVGGVVDIIDDERTGLLVLPKDIDGLSQAVMRLIKDRELAERLVTAARDKLEAQFTLEHMAGKTLSVYKELLEMMNILVIKISSVGDVVLVTPSLKALRQKFPKSKIYCLVGKEAHDVLKNCPHIDGLIVADLIAKSWPYLFKLGRELRRYRFDKVIDFQNSRKSHLLSFLSFSRESYGYDNGKWSKLLSNPLKATSGPMSPVEHQFQLLKLLDIPYDQNVRLEWWLSNKDERYIEELFDSEWLGHARNVVGINIAASLKWRSKNWPIEHIARLCDLLAVRNIRVVITGTEKDKAFAYRLLEMTKAKPALFVGKTDIQQLGALIKKCRAYITPDSAPLHVAASVGTPVIALFGPTDSRRHIPPHKDMIILEKKPACSPCYSPECRIKTHVCMRDITPEEVTQKIEDLLGET